MTCHIDHDAAEVLYRQGCELGLTQHIYNTEGRMLVVDADATERAYLSSMPGTEFVSSEGHPSIASFFGADDVVKVIFASSGFAMLRELGERQRPELAAHGIDVTDDARPHCDVVLKTRARTVPSRSSMSASLSRTSSEKGCGRLVRTRPTSHSQKRRARTHRPSPSHQPISPARKPYASTASAFSSVAGAPSPSSAVIMEWAAFLPAPMARMTVAAPVTMSPPAQTFGLEVWPFSSVSM